MSLIYFWVRYITEPLKNLSLVAGDLRGAKPEELDLWLENLKRVDAQGQVEVAVIQQVLQRLGTAVPKLGQRLITGEGRACLGQVLTRGLPVLQAWQAEMQNLERQLTAGEIAESSRQKLVVLQARIATVLEDLAYFGSGPEEEWGQVDLTPGLERAWRLATLGLPAEVTPHLELTPLPPVWGSAAALSLAGLYLLTFAADLVAETGDLGLSTAPTPAGGVRLTVWMSGRRYTPQECQEWLNPFGEPGGLQGPLGPALAAAIAAQHGGSLTAAPREAGGAVFSLELPPSTAAQEAHEPDS
jgi:hypothetical protein